MFNSKATGESRREEGKGKDKNKGLETTDVLRRLLQLKATEVGLREVDGIKLKIEVGCVGFWLLVSQAIENGFEDVETTPVHLRQSRRKNNRRNTSVAGMKAPEG